MANEVKEATIQRLKEDAKKYNERHIDRHLSIPSVQVDDFSVRLGYDAGYDAHESAIRTAAAAVFEQFEILNERHQKLSEPKGVCIQTLHGCPLCDEFNLLHGKLAALKAELETPKGKEME